MMHDYESGGGEALGRPGQNGVSEQNRNLVGLSHDFEVMLRALANNCKEKGCLPRQYFQLRNLKDGRAPLGTHEPGGPNREAAGTERRKPGRGGGQGGCRHLGVRGVGWP